MNKKILLLSVVLGFSAMSNASEPKYAFPQSDKPVISKIKIKKCSCGFREIWAWGSVSKWDVG